MHDHRPQSIVPFVAWRCPRCGARRCRTYGHRGRVRLHQCRECRARFKSLEFDPRDASERLGMLPAPPPPPPSAQTRTHD